MSNVSSSDERNDQLLREEPMRRALVTASGRRISTLGVVRILTLAVTFCTGFTGLIYENAWQRYLANFLGSQAQATAVILAVFLGGLCVGYRVFGRVSQGKSPRNLLQICGATEIVIGIWALIFHWVYAAVWGMSGVVDPKSFVSAFWEIGVSVALMGLPTVLMGGTLPLLTQALAADLEDASPFHARVYAVNTGGAFVGCLLAGFVLLPLFGLRGTMQIAGPVNIIAGILLYYFGQYVSDELPVSGPEEVAAASAEVGHIPERAAIAIAFLAGVYSIALQTVFVRVVALSMGSSEYAFSIVVAVFIAMLALGAWKIAGTRLFRVPVWFNQLIVVLGGFGVYYSVSYWPYICHVVRAIFATVPPAFWLYHAAIFLTLGLILAVPVGAMGSTMPLLFNDVKRSLGDVGKVVGRLYAWNTIGCVVGALFGGYWLLLYFNLDEIFRFCLIGMALALLFSCPWSSLRPSIRPFCIASVFAFFVLPLFLPQWNQEYLANGYFRTSGAMQESFNGAHALWSVSRRGVKQIFYKDSPNSTVSVTEYAADDDAKALNDGAEIIRNIKVNGKSDGETSGGDMRTMRLTAHLPSLFSPIPIKRVAIVGFGLGVSAGSLTLYPEIEDVHVMEISHGVHQAAKYFDFANYNVTKNPKIRWSLGDAYRVLGASRDKYSLIISEPSNPWVTGVERLFAREFYDIVKSKLEPGGIYTQWIHDYTVSAETVGLVVRTFGDAFRYVRIFRTNRDIIMLGSDEFLGERSLTRAIERYNSLPTIQKALAQVEVPNIQALLGLEMWMTKEQFGPGPIQTLEFPRLSHMAGHDFFLDADVDLSSYLGTPERRLWARAYAQQALVMFPIRLPGERINTLRSYTQAACDIKVPWFWANWKSEQKHCRDSLVGMAVHGMIRPGNGFEQQEASLLRLLLNDSLTTWSVTPATPSASPTGDEMEVGAAEGSISAWQQLAPQIKIPEVRGMADLYGSYSSIFTPLSPEKLLTAARVCLESGDDEALRCRSQLVEVLAVTGSPKEAANVMTSLERDNSEKSTVTNERMEWLRSLIAVSTQAQVTYASRISP